MTRRHVLAMFVAVISTPAATDEAKAQLLLTGVGGKGTDLPNGQIAWNPTLSGTPLGAGGS